MCRYQPRYTDIASKQRAGSNEDLRLAITVSKTVSEIGLVPRTGKPSELGEPLVLAPEELSKLTVTMLKN